MTVRLARRWALLLVASALAAGPVVVAPSAAADTTFRCTSGQPCVHVTFPDGGYPAVNVPASAMDSLSGNDDTFDTTYHLLDQNGGTSDDYVKSGLSLRGLLSLIPTSPGPDAVTSVVMSNADTGYQSTLQAGDLDIDPTPFEGGILGPIFDVYGNDSAIEYVRPQRSTADANGSDRFLTGLVSTTIDMQVYTTNARPLHPRVVTVGKGPWKVGEFVTFDASFAADDPPHGGVTFKWIFAKGDRPTPGQQSTMYSYGEGGTYLASVEVSGTGPDGEAYEGLSNDVTVHVKGRSTAPPSAVKSPGGNGTGGKHHPTTGPDKSHRAHHAGSAPTGGQVAAPPSDGAPTDTSGPTGTGGPTAAGPTTPAPTAGTSDPVTNTAAPGSGDDGALVQGVLIDGSLAPAGGAVASSATRVAVSAQRPGRLSTSFDARWLWLLAPVLLLVGGALGERRRVPHRHGRKSRL